MKHVLALAALCAIAAPVAAQDLSGNDVRVALDKGAACLVESEGGKVKHFLKLHPASKEAVRVAKFLSTTECMNSITGHAEVAYGPDVLRGALFKQLYIRDFAAAAPASAAAPDFKADAAHAPAASADYLGQRAFAACVADADALQARKLVLAVPQSRAELEAFYYLKEKLEGCRVRPGDANLSRAAISGLVAEVLYRRARPDGDGDVRA